MTCEHRQSAFSEELDEDPISGTAFKNLSTYRRAKNKDLLEKVTGTSQTLKSLFRNYFNGRKLSLWSVNGRFVSISVRETLLEPAGLIILIEGEQCGCAWQGAQKPNSSTEYAIKDFAGRSGCSSNRWSISWRMQYRRRHHTLHPSTYSSSMYWFCVCVINDDSGIISPIIVFLRAESKSISWYCLSAVLDRTERTQPCFISKLVWQYVAPLSLSLVVHYQDLCNILCYFPKT